MSTIDSKYEDSLQPQHQMNISSHKNTETISQDNISPSKVLTPKLLDCFKSTTLYDTHKIFPIPFHTIEKMYQELGSKEGSNHHKSIESKLRFSYKTLLGEIMYAYMTCRFDIGCDVTNMLKSSGIPSEYHYGLLKQVSLYF